MKTIEQARADVLSANEEYALAEINHTKSRFRVNTAKTRKDEAELELRLTLQQADPK